METGAALPKTELIIKLAEIFEVSVDELLNSSVKVTEDRKEKATTLQDLYAKTTAMFQEDENLTLNREKSLSFSVKAAKVYIITILSMFLFFSAALSFLGIRYWEIIGTIFNDTNWLLFETFAIIALLGLTTGLFCYIYFFPRFPTVLKIVSIILSGLSFVVIFYGGIILLIPTIIKSSKLIISSRGAKNEKRSNKKYCK